MKRWASAFSLSVGDPLLTPELVCLLALSLSVLTPGSGFEATMSSGCEISERGNGKLNQSSGTSNSGFPPQSTCYCYLPNPQTAIPCVTFKFYNCIHWKRWSRVCLFLLIQNWGLLLFVNWFKPISKGMWDDGNEGSFVILESTCSPCSPSYPH